MPAIGFRVGGWSISVTVISSSTTEDKYGDATTTATEEPLSGVLFAPRSSQERTDNTSPAVITAASLYIPGGLPDGVTLDSDDTIRISDVHPLIDGTYQVEGIPGYWAGPVEVAIKRTGAA